MNTDSCFDTLLELGIATHDELCLITSINGNNLEAYESVLYCRTGLRSFDQLEGERE